MTLWKRSEFMIIVTTKINYMRYKKFILILLGNCIQIALHGQLCDSSIAVCPKVFDYLISQDVKEQQYAVDNSILKAEVTNLTFQLKETKSVLETTSSILLITNEQKQTLQSSVDLKDKTIRKQKRQIAAYKVGILSVGIAGVGGLTYLGVKQLFN